MTRKEIKAICEAAGVKEIEDVSDGYHTFKQLYYQRMILFAALVKQNRNKAWKSLRHEDGELCFGGGWFIVGIDTPEGSYTYHYEDSFYSLFDCIELERGKHWDGHTEKDVTRLLSLEQEPCEDTVSRHAAIDAFERFIHELGIEDEPYNYGEMALSVKNVPPVNPQPKIGWWLHRENMDYLDKNKVIHNHFMCKDCGFIHDFIDGHTAQYKYCPQCGCRMAEPQERSK